MRDAIGGAVTVVIIVVFIVIVSGYLAFNVNYTKAFRMKNKIISYYDDYNGDCETDPQCRRKIRDYAKEVGYNPAKLKCPEGYTQKENLYCSKKVEAGGKSNDPFDDRRVKTYYKIVTKINIEIPIVNYFFDISLFNVTGDTKIYIQR